MIVRRIKDDELYHHGIKGQRWGKRKKEPSGTAETAMKRGQYHNNRVRAWQTVQNLDADKRKAKRNFNPYHNAVNEKERRAQSEQTSQRRWEEFAKEAYSSLDRQDSNFASVETNGKKQLSKPTYKSPNSKAINDKYNQQQKAFEKNQHEHVKVNEGKSFTYKGVYYPNGKSEAESERRVQQRYGKDYKMDDPSFTPYDKDNAKQAWEAKHKEEVAEKRRTEYKDAAFAKNVENEFRIKESKKVINKLKLFGKSFKEVHSENIKKGVDAVKKIFKRK